MSTPILATKLYIPSSRSDLVHRQRLIQTLDNGLSCKLTLASAPAGFGKTTIISEWVTHSNRPVAWLSLDEDDQDPKRFLTYFIAALQTVESTFGDAILSMLQSPQLPPIESILTLLVNEIAGLAKNIILVLDDYHVLDSSTIDDMLGFLIEHLPPQLHLVITTREDPNIHLARLRARRQLSELRINDLRFTPEEVAEFLSQVMGLGLSAEDISALEARTEGWIAGLQLAAISMQGHGDHQQFIQSFTGSHHFVLDYLVEEVLHQQPEHIQHFLLYTSILDRFCGSLCDDVLSLESGSGQETLAYLQQANLFLIPLDSKRNWYRYHHLFADLLQQRLQQLTSSTNINIDELHIRASEWFENQGFEVEAFHHAATVNDVPRAERLIDGNGIPLYFRGTTVPIIHWLEALPTSVLNKKPSLWILYASVLSLSGKANEEIEPKLLAAENLLNGKKEDTTIRNLIGQIAATRARMAAGQYQIEDMLTQSRRALDYLQPESLAVRTVTIWTLGLAEQYLGNRAQAIQAFTEAITLSETSGNLLVNIIASTGLGMMQEAQNQLFKAEQTYKQVLALSGTPPVPAACEAVLGLARICYEWNDLHAAEQYAKQSIHLAKQIASSDSFISGEILLAKIKFAHGDITSASTILEQAEQSARQLDFDEQIPNIVSLQVTMLLQQGNITAAQYLAKNHDLPLVHARIHLAQDDTSTALQLLETLQAQAETRDWKDIQLKVKVLQAIIYHVRHEEEPAEDVIIDALSTAKPENFIRTFIDEGEWMAELLSTISTHGIMPNYINALLATFEEAQTPHSNQPTTNTAQPLIEPLSDRELEILQLVADGFSNREISDKLFLALSTVKGHNRNIYGKLQVQRRTEAVARARELGLLSSDN